MKNIFIITTALFIAVNSNAEIKNCQDAEKAMMVDTDVDEAQGIKHAFEVLGHIFTAGKTHPFDIHQILTYFFPHLHLGYDLVPK